MSGLVVNSSSLVAILLGEPEPMRIVHALRFGRGSGHRAKLNLADFAAYALAVSRDLPLLYRGDDFAATDVRSALDEPAP